MGCPHTTATRLAALLLAVAGGLLSPSVANAAWVLPGWQWRQQVPLDTRGLEQTSANVPVLLKLDATRIQYSTFRSDGADLRVFDDDGFTPLDYEIEQWDPTGTSLVWVLVPKVNSKAEMGSLWLYWGKPNAANVEDPASVWADYGLVLHLDDDVVDATGNFTTGGRPESWGSGPLGDSAVFSSTPGSAIGTVPALDGYLHSTAQLGFWVKTTTSSAGLIGATQLMTPGLTILWGTWNSWGYPCITMGSGTACGTTPIDDGSWHHVVLGRDQASTALTVWTDGALEATAIGSPGTGFHSVNAIGFRDSYLNDPAYFTGEIDELRIGPPAPHSDWMKADYRSQTDDLVRWTCIGTVYNADNDGDGHGNPLVGLSTCAEPGFGWVSNGDDCDDADASSYPGATELCDGIDNDCDPPTVLVSEDFEAGVSGTEWSFTGTASYQQSGNTYLGPIDGNLGSMQQVVLDLGDQPAGDYTLDFTLYWFGTIESGDGDFLLYKGDAFGELLATQGWLGTAPQGGDSASLAIDVTHGGGALYFTFVGALNASYSNEWWGLDDVLVGGPPQVDEGCPLCADVDSDGDCSIAEGGTDCDDGDPSVNGNATEIPGNPIDEDCSGSIQCYLDLDGDGYGVDTGEAVEDEGDGQCLPIDGEATQAGDCDDQQSTTNPGASEICGDGLDNDCTGTPDDGDLWYLDGDEDGYGEPGDVVNYCEDPSANGVFYVLDDTDCDDADPARNPGAYDFAGNGMDEDCSGADASLMVFGSSIDEDGVKGIWRADGLEEWHNIDFGVSRDVVTGPDGTLYAGDDAGSVHHLTSDGTRITGHSVSTSAVLGLFYDLYTDTVLVSDSGGTIWEYDPSTGLSTALVSAGAITRHALRLAGDDTVFLLVEGGELHSWSAPSIGTSWVADFPTDVIHMVPSRDGDLYVSSALLEMEIYKVDLPSGTVTIAYSLPSQSGGMCADSAPGEWVILSDSRDGYGMADPESQSMTFLADWLGEMGGCATNKSPDHDGDGYFDARLGGDDCDDWNDTIHPDAGDACGDGVDEDCNGVVDDGPLWYLDGDGDGYGVPETSLRGCAAPSGYVDNDLDCDDSDPTVHPLSYDRPGNGIDEDCGGADDPSLLFLNNAAGALYALERATMTVVWSVDYPGGQGRGAAFGAEGWVYFTERDEGLFRIHASGEGFELVDGNIDYLFGAFYDWSTDTVLVASTNNAVYEYDPATQLSTTIASGLPGSVRAVARREGEDRLWLSDAQDSDFYEHDLLQSSTSVFTTFNDPPRQMAFAADGGMWVAGTTGAEAHHVDLDTATVTTYPLTGVLQGVCHDPLTGQLLFVNSNGTLELLDPTSGVDTTLLAGAGSNWSCTTNAPPDADDDGFVDIRFGGWDCDDTDDTVFPGAPETYYDGVDSNCDGANDFDADEDGYVEVSWPGEAGGTAPDTGDCDDEDDSVWPGATEILDDTVDQDCNGYDSVSCWLDDDEDGQGSKNAVPVTAPDGSCDDFDKESDVATDCNDGDVTIFLGAPETPDDTIDQDCNGYDTVSCYPDVDHDGFGDQFASVFLVVDGACLLGRDESPTTDDCDDSRSDVHPGGNDLPDDGLDQDCSGAETVTCYADVDGDGQGTDSGAYLLATDGSCDAGEDESDVATDCDDGNIAIYLGATEILDDGIDQDCNGDDTVSCYPDADQDGYGQVSAAVQPAADGSCDLSAFESASSDDCDDNAIGTHPDATDIPDDDIDQDCSGIDTKSCIVDSDHDGQGTTVGTPILSPDGPCDTAQGESMLSTDCVDSEPTIHLGAAETLDDNIDQDCNGFDAVTCYQDADHDGYGDEAAIVDVGVLADCVPAEGRSWNATDCNDADASVHPGAAEVPNDGIDQNCDDSDAAACYADADGDTYGDPYTTIVSTDADCTDPGEAPTGLDCDDADVATWPGAQEIVDDGKDQDCNGQDTITCAEDADRDGYGDLFGATRLAPDGRCDKPQYESDNALDCNDAVATIFPGAIDLPDDTIDQDCSGTDTVTCYVDDDADGYGSDPAAPIFVASGSCDLAQDASDWSTDCDDADPAIHPGALETCGDGIDSDCDGAGGSASDDDGDGWTFAEEYALGADDCNPDSDGDGDGDSAEIARGDTDSDGIPDVVDLDDDGDGIDTTDEDRDANGDPTDDDTDGDNIPDHLDVDDDGDGVLTADEDWTHEGDPASEDTDLDTIPDYLDDDDDGDGVPTSWELAFGANPWVADSDDDGILDGWEWGTGGASEPRDTDGDGWPDIDDNDDDGDGLLTLDEGLADSDGDETCQLAPDGIPAYLDVDSDGDGICDGNAPTTAACTSWMDSDRDPTPGGTLYAIEDFSDDLDNDGVPNVADCDDLDGGAGDADGDGLSNLEEDDLGTNPAKADTDGDGVPDGVEVGDPQLPWDTDDDGTIDALDVDDDGDGVPTSDELYGETWSNAPDTDGDDLPDYLDEDDDDDGIDTIDEDWDQDLDPTNDDLDSDGIADYLDADHDDGPSGDLDGDGLSNEIEQSLGTDPTDPDSDDDGIVDGDEVEFDGTPFDTDNDGLIDALDDDDDDDGVPTAVEALQDPPDTDGDAVPDYLDDDDDDDGIPTSEEDWDGDGDPTNDDVDGDNRPDYLDDDHTDGPLAQQDTDEPPGALVPRGCEGCAGASAPLPVPALLFALPLIAVLRRRRRPSA